jgi:hypothetical protein
MGTEPVVDWPVVEARFTANLVDAMKEKLIDGTSSSVDAQLLALETGASEDDATELLNLLAGLAALKKRVVLRCPVETCGHILDSSEASTGECSQCGTVFQREGLKPTETVEFRIEGEVSRGVSWLVAVHGFNTVGEWQEEFSWRIAHKYRRRAPVLNYKFGLVRPGVLFRWRHRQLAAQLGKRINAAGAFAAQDGLTDPPDLILHSFGTLLFVTMLAMKEFNDLRFGRVILSGSIVRPDFDWRQYLDTGRIDAILNHCGQQDWPVQIAILPIPESGPSGHSGFNDAAVLNVLSQGYGHGTFWEQPALKVNLARGGLWDRFLRYPGRSLRSIGSTFERETPWEPLPQGFWFILRWAVFSALSIGVVFFLLLGLRLLSRWLGLVG